jgi:hypothetical protein
MIAMEKERIEAALAACKGRVSGPSGAATNLPAAVNTGLSDQSASDRQTALPGQLAVSLPQSLSCVRTVTAQGGKAGYRENGFGPGGLDEELLPTKAASPGGMSCCRYSGSCSSS